MVGGLETYNWTAVKRDETNGFISDERKGHAQPNNTDDDTGGVEPHLDLLPGLISRWFPPRRREDLRRRLIWGERLAIRCRVQLVLLRGILVRLELSTLSLRLVGLWRLHGGGVEWWGVVWRVVLGRGLVLRGRHFGYRGSLRDAK